MEPKKKYLTLSKHFRKLTFGLKNYNTTDTV